jgi:hypothetical protein
MTILETREIRRPGQSSVYVVDREQTALRDLGHLVSIALIYCVERWPWLPAIVALFVGASILETTDR